MTPLRLALLPDPSFPTRGGAAARRRGALLALTLALPACGGSAFTDPASSQGGSGRGGGSGAGGAGASSGGAAAVAGPGGAGTQAGAAGTLAGAGSSAGGSGGASGTEGGGGQPGDGGAAGQPGDGGAAGQAGDGGAAGQAGGGGSGVVSLACAVVNDHIGCCDDSDTALYCNAEGKLSSKLCGTASPMCGWDPANHRYGCTGNNNNDPSKSAPRACNKVGAADQSSVCATVNGHLGCCDAAGNNVFCNGKGYLFTKSCAPGTCGWDPAGQHYACDTAGGDDPAMVTPRLCADVPAGK